MDKVYIVSQGEYSDYHIVKVFANKEDAENFVEVQQGAFGWHAYYDIETWEVE